MTATANDSPNLSLRRIPKDGVHRAGEEKLQVHVPGELLLTDLDTCLKPLSSMSSSGNGVLASSSQGCYEGLIRPSRCSVNVSSLPPSSPSTPSVGQVRSAQKCTDAAFGLSEISLP